MRVTAVRIENFRGIKQLKLELDETTVLIGENNSGKTAVLDALRLCLRDLGARRRTVFDTLDFHLPDADAEPSSAEPIQIEVLFSEQEMGEWNDQLIGRLNRDGIQGKRIISCFLPWGYVVFVRCMEVRFMLSPFPLAWSVFYALIVFGVAGLFGRYPRPAYRAVSSASFDRYSHDCRVRGDLRGR